MHKNNDYVNTRSHLLKFLYLLWQDPLADAPLDLKVKSLERYLGVDLVAFRLREAQAELSYSPTTIHPSGAQPTYTAAESVKEKREWKDPTADIILTGTTLPVIINLISIQFFSPHTC